MYITYLEVEPEVLISNSNHLTTELTEIFAMATGSLLVLFVALTEICQQPRLIDLAKTPGLMAQIDQHTV